jgi:hypothetical protein
VVSGWCRDSLDNQLSSIASGIITTSNRAPPCIDDSSPFTPFFPDKIIDKMRTSMLRSTGTVAAALRSSVRSTQTRRAHAISNPTLANIEKRWEVMPPQEQADLWMALRDRMKVDWTEMTLQEKKAGMSIFCHKARTRPIGELSYANQVC